MKMLFIFLFSFFSLKVNALIIAVVDAPLCKNIFASNIVIHGSAQKDCPFPLPPDRKYHGNFVIQNFLQNYHSSKDEKITIYHFSVFDNQGEQNRQLWLKALAEVSVLKPDLTIMAVGYFGNTSDFPSELSGLTILAAGTVGLGIKRDTILWPQLLDDHKIFLVGHFFPSKKRHQVGGLKQKQGQIGPDLLTKSRVQYFVAESTEKENLGGSSRATSLAAASVLNKCKNEVLSKNIAQLKACLLKKNTLFLSENFVEKIELTP